MSVALVTGGRGFVGTHLRPELRSRGWSVVTLGRTGTSTVDHRAVDLRDPDAVGDVLADVKPDVVYHLAALTGGPVESIVEHNVAAARGLGEALRRSGRPYRVVLAGSSAQYGSAPSPVTEDSILEPVSAYGHAKAAAESVLRGLAADGVFTVIPVRAFNHIGPGEPPATVAGAFARRIRAVIDGHADRVNVGGLDAVRDFTDVRDIARGYADLGENGVPGRVYHLCSGRATTIGEVLDALLGAAGLDRSVVGTSTEPPSARGGPLAYQVGSAERTWRDVGWTPAIDLAQSTKDLWEQS